MMRLGIIVRAKQIMTLHTLQFKSTTAQAKTRGYRRSYLAVAQSTNSSFSFWSSLLFLLHLLLFCLETLLFLCLLCALLLFKLLSPVYLCSLSSFLYSHSIPLRFDGNAGIELCSFWDYRFKNEDHIDRHLLSTHDRFKYYDTGVITTYMLARLTFFEVPACFAIWSWSTGSCLSGTLKKSSMFVLTRKPKWSKYSVGDQSNSVEW